MNRRPSSWHLRSNSSNLADEGREIRSTRRHRDWTSKFLEGGGAEYLVASDTVDIVEHVGQHVDEFVDVLGSER